MTGIEQCQCRKARIQRNHIACALLVWTRLKHVAHQKQTTIYQVKHGLLHDYLVQQLKRPNVHMILAKVLNDSPGNFENHYLIRYSGKYYDPSYYIGPCSTREEWEDSALAGFAVLIRLSNSSGAVADFWMSKRNSFGEALILKLIFNLGQKNRLPWQFVLLQFCTFAICFRVTGQPSEKLLATQTMTKDSEKMTWRLTYTADVRKNFSIGDQTFEQTGTVIRLRRRIWLSDAPSRPNPQLVWRYFAGDFPSPRRTQWSGNISVDLQENKVYVLLSEGIRFRVFVLPANRTQDDNESEKLTFSSANIAEDDKSVISLNSKVATVLPFIKRATLIRSKDNLKVVINKEEDTEQHWLYSLVTRKWTRLEVKKQPAKTSKPTDDKKFVKQ